MARAVVVLYRTRPDAAERNQVLVERSHTTDGPACELARRLAIGPIEV
jgi:hypothetical protein